MDRRATGRYVMSHLVFDLSGEVLFKQGRILIELITGQNNLNYMNNKVYGSEDLCRFCEEEEETFDHIINECPCFYLDRCDLLQNQPIICLLYTSPSPRD